MRLNFTYIYAYSIRMSVVRTCLSSACHSYVLVYNGMSLICTSMSSVCQQYALECHPYGTRRCSYVIRMSLVCTRMSSVCHSSYELVCRSYVTLMYSYVIRMSLVCGFTINPSYVTRLWFYHEPFTLIV